jgi:hypothetical protein
MRVDSTLDSTVRQLLAVISPKASRFRLPSVVGFSEGLWY